jgi:hypothetical protein
MRSRFVCVAAHWKKNRFQLGCQMVRFQTKNTNLGKFWRVVRWEMLVYFRAIWSILWPSGIFYGFLVFLKVNSYILPGLVSCSKKNLATLP